MKRTSSGVKHVQRKAFTREVARIAKKRQYTEQVVPDLTLYQRKPKHTKRETDSND